SVLFLKLHCSFAIFEPSGNACPLAGTPALYASIMIGLATMTLSTSSVRAVDTTAQSSYPLQSEKAIPLRDFREYLSNVFCASPAAPSAARTAVVVAIDRMLWRFMDDPFPLNLGFLSGDEMPAPLYHRATEAWSAREDSA